MATISVIGLGFVGVPMADLCARKGHTTYGIDIDARKIDDVKRGINASTGEKIAGTIHATADYGVSATCEIILLCVPTPIGEAGTTDLSALESAGKSLAPHLKKGHLVILESTVYPGVTEDVLIPALEKSGLVAGEDFDVAYCPERIDQGNKKWTVENLPRVLGGASERSVSRALAFYQSVLTAQVMPLSSIKAAEAEKIYENTFRDVNIALANELAKAFDHLGLDITEIVRGAATKPFGFMPFYPSAGVGGTCIPMSATYLAEWAEKGGAQLPIIRAARATNASMPEYTARLTLSEMEKEGLPLTTPIGILGVAYKGGVPDKRDSPALEVIRHLRRLGASLHVFDPHLPGDSSVQSIEELTRTCPVLVLLTDHPEFRGIDLSKTAVLIDGKNFFDKNAMRGVRYHGIGRK